MSGSSEQSRTLRRRLSTDTDSVFSVLPPPYALEDVVASQTVARHKTRVGTLDVICNTTWAHGGYDVTWEIDPHTGEDPSSSVGALTMEVTFLLVDSIQRGHPPLMTLSRWRRRPGVKEIYDRVRGLWLLCVSIGANVHDIDRQLDAKSAQMLADLISWAHKVISTFAVAMEEYGVMGAESEAGKVTIAHHIARWMSDKDKITIDGCMRSLALYRILLQSERIA